VHQPRTIATRLDQYSNSRRHPTNALLQCRVCAGDRLYPSGILSSSLPRDPTHHAANARFQIVWSGALSWPASN